MKTDSTGLLIVISGPSGVGKTTICDRLLRACPGIVRSVTCTTRPPRGNEVDGRDYSFLSTSEFEKRIAADEFLEHAVVHGNKYGTLRTRVEGVLAKGTDVLLAIDVQGAAQVRNRVSARAGKDGLKVKLVDMFINPPSMETLRERLAVRNEDSPEVVKVRLANAEKEMESGKLFRYSVVNDRVDRAVNEIMALLEKERGRCAHG